MSILRESKDYNLEPLLKNLPRRLVTIMISGHYWDFALPLPLDNSRECEDGTAVVDDLCSHLTDISSKVNCSSILGT